MNRNLLFLATAGFLLIAPIAHQQIYGTEPAPNTGVMQSRDIQNEENIAKNIRNAILADTNLSNFVNNIHVDEKDGVVTLSGVVNSNNAKSGIEAKAKAVMGVKKVINNIEVKS